MKAELLQKYLEEVELVAQRTLQKTPAQRARSKKGFSFSKQSPEMQFLIWDYIWKNGKWFWVKIQAFFFVEKFLKNEQVLLSFWPGISTWQDHVDGWALCDCLSKIYSRLLEIDESTVMPRLKEWNVSTDPWKRRQSIVSLIYYTSVRKVLLPFPKLTALIKPLISDKDYYVQKGLGWTLRELYRAYPMDTLNFLDQHLTDLPALAFSTISPALSKETRTRVKRKRKSDRN